MPMTQQHSIGQTLMLVARDFQRRLDSDLAARGILGIRHRHNDVFLYLGRNGPSRGVDLASAAGIRPQSMMKIIQELEQQGLVERRPDPADSRAKLVNFTAAGESLIDELSESTANVWQHYQAIIGSQQLTRTLNNLDTLIAEETIA
ncbi:MarR family transcriptional regulator [Halieaceae bacterium IMCC8485]|jgi:DNA-binding MarR family transcriptional regulator|uniref:MarR family transcriptional regulator n=2 Tax=Candidatus Seongchinamella marina TaxID=2518990 RepID=A0ABT3SRL6_9GAMM|nr:MarR family transcriptional regulator [Candidatus Seongchinamella marina]